MAQVRQLLPSTRVDWPADTNGRRCLVVTIAPAAPQRLDSLIIGLEEPRGIEWTTRASRFASERQAFMATLRRSVSLANKFGDEDGANIVLGRISAAPAVAMTVNIATYGQIVRTSDSLVNEFAAFADLASRSAWRRRPRPLRFRGDDVLKVLPWRRQVHAWDDLAALLVAPRGRARGLGVSLALVDDRSAGASVFVARRSSSVGSHGGGVPDRLRPVWDRVCPPGLAVVGRPPGVGYPPAVTRLDRDGPITVFAPARVDLSPGFTDVEPFCTDLPGHIVNVALDRGIEVTVRSCAAEQLGDSFAERLCTAIAGRLGVARPALRLAAPSLPVGGGLGMSGALSVALACALSVLAAAPVGPADLAALACAGERDTGLLGGTQDQLSSAHGGAGLVQRHGSTSRRRPIEADLPALAARLVLVHGGGVRNSGSIIEHVLRTIRSMNRLAEDMVPVLAGGDHEWLADLMNESTSLLTALHPAFVASVTAAGWSVLPAAPGALGARRTG